MENHTEFASPTQPSVYEQYADLEEKAIASQRRIYEAKFPPPAEPKMSDKAKYVITGFGIIFAAAVIVSGAHTIPLFQRSVPEYEIEGFSLKNLVGIAAFVMIEMAMIILTYSRITHYTSTQRDTWQRGVRLITRFIISATMMVFAVALFANIYSTLTLSHNPDGKESIQEPTAIANLRTVGTEQKPAALLGIEIPDLPEIAEISLFVLMGASAPVLTLLSGEIIGHTLTVENATNEKRQEKHDEEMLKYNQAFNEYYEAKKGKGVWKVGVPQQQAAPPQPVKLLERPEEPAVNDLQPIKRQVDGKVKYECPACSKVITRQAWQNHKCRYVN